jgi:hypothetical protein
MGRHCPRHLGFWCPGLTKAGAYLFCAFASLSLTLQARGVKISPPPDPRFAPVPDDHRRAGRRLRRLGQTPDRRPAALGIPDER